MLYYTLRKGHLLYLILKLSSTKFVMWCLLTIYVKQIEYSHEVAFFKIIYRLLVLYK